MQSQVFIRRALARFGIKGQLRFCALPSGGAADKYVLDNYAKEVVAARRRLAKADTALIVHIDADPENTVAERHAQGRIVSCLEGGYNLSALARSVAAHLRVLAEV